jgi:hypothetical protein
MITLRLSQNLSQRLNSNIMRLQIPHEKYLRILSPICICNAKSIINNQIHALHYFPLESPWFRFHFRKQERPEMALAEVFLRWLVCIIWITILELFLSYFNLLGNVCANRYKFARKNVEDFSCSISCPPSKTPIAWSKSNSTLSNSELFRVELKPYYEMWETNDSYGNQDSERLIA